LSMERNDHILRFFAKDPDVEELFGAWIDAIIDNGKDE